MLSELFVPDWMKDDENAYNAFGSSQVRERFIDLAVQDEWTLHSHILEVASENVVDDRVAAVLQQSIEHAPAEQCPSEPTLRLSGTVEEAEADLQASIARSEVKHACGVELYLALACRATNSFACPFLIICLSLMALKSGLPEDCWDVLSFLFVLRSKPWITKFARDVTERLRDKFHGDPDVR